MPFGVKNAGANYQSTMRHTFQDQIGGNMEVYINNLVVKSKRKGDMLPNLHETFGNLRRNLIKLNLEKCVLGWGMERSLGSWSLIAVSGSTR